MTQAQFKHLASQIIQHEEAATDETVRVYWFKHFARLISLIRHQNIYGA